MTATTRYYLKQLGRTLGVIVCIFVATTAATIAVMYIYNWFVPVDWPSHHDDVERLFYGVMFGITFSLLFNHRKG
jgi:hypothetical protein